MSKAQWSFGDRLVHGSRPEWGIGTVTSAQPDHQDGQACQRLTIRFERVGLKTLSTAHAELRPEAEVPALASGVSEDPFGPLSAADARAAMTKLPEEVNNPFATSRARLKAALDIFRFTGEGGSLIDWAAMQSGLKDPMTRFNRHELEELFRRFCQNRDEHLKKLVIELVKREPAVIAELVPTAPRAAQQLLRRINLPR